MLIKILIALRYLLVEAIGWLIWYKLFRNKVAYKKIQLAFPTRKDYAREIFYSFVTVIIFAIVPAAIFLTPFRHYTQFYTDIHQYGMFYFWLVFPLILIIHDTYFYWIHRLMHHPLVFKRVHLVHHKSLNPSPWAAISFHPLEAFLETGILLVLAMIMPVTKWHLIFIFMFMMVYIVYGHLGWELYPKGFTKSWWGKWINTAVSHNQHHEDSKCNYGLYFLWWDKMMGTQRYDYEERFEEVTGRRKEKAITTSAYEKVKQPVELVQEIG
jgi:Delta7-sterol 5-desaturase